ncbi:hypothetical protein B9Z51_12625 [Limnohabitans sp. T6-5]|uniref:REP-associated tyrosine transposase n=1 Tax=Limnohabitans sp. T6-5 TaxID=1100724 RepID=UPI000D367176|nr:transposase [Limnohabitans sp. T6-5]PUE06778.1 hypothetical protein B9Z51_12625 [Limnohabitans sp. T6-5]
MQYRRSLVAGGTYFFTLVTHGRAPWFAHAPWVDALGEAMRHVRQTHPFETLAIAVMPDHLHCLWRLPEGDADYATRWMLIKQTVTRCIRAQHPGAKVWQDRFWEHTIRNDNDYAVHCNYIHFNPVKHGLVAQASDWQHSSFARFVAEGIYDTAWGVSAMPRMPIVSPGE